MKTCPLCHREYPDTENFCCQDGAALVEAKPLTNCCPNCGNEYKPGDKFCCNCGCKLPDVTTANMVEYAPGSWISRIFPIDGIYLGRTTIPEAQKLPLFVHSPYNNYTGIVRGEKAYQYTCDLKSTDYQHHVSNELYLHMISKLPESLSELGMDAQMSVAAFEGALRSQGFSVTKSCDIKTKLFKNSEFSATMNALSPDGTVALELYFFDNRLHHTQAENSCTLPGTLASVRIYSRNYNGFKNIF